MPKLLDLYCGGGGAGMGYHLAGFDVTGVDMIAQPHYPFEFVQSDAITYLCDNYHKYDVIHASPPCQTHSRLRRIKTIDESVTQRYNDMIGITRAILRFIGLPYVIENVEGAPLHNPIMLCGSMFDDLRVYRHRLFESNILLYAPPHAAHNDNTPMAGRGVSDKGFVSITSGGLRNPPAGYTGAQYKSFAMGIDWMPQKDLTLAIPPAYTRYIGKQLLACL